MDNEGSPNGSGDSNLTTPHLPVDERLIGRDPFEGIDFFQNMDKEKVQAIEQGERGKTGWLRCEYYPRVGHVRILKNTQGLGGKNQIAYWEYECRTQHGWSHHGTPDDGDMRQIREGIDILHENGIDTTTPLGFPEITGVMREAAITPKLGYQDLRYGKYYLVHDEDEIYVYKHDRAIKEKFDATEDIVRVYRLPDNILGRRDYLRIFSSGEPAEPLIGGALVFYVNLPKEGASRWGTRREKDIKIYELTKDQVDRVGMLSPAVEDPLVGTEWTRERLCIYTAIQGMQYERWGKDEVGEGERYTKVNRENYQEAIDNIIQRFGEEIFASEVESIMLNHLIKLHTVKHLPGSPYKPHSDISPLGTEYMNLAKQVIKGAHPLPEDMSESGHWVNAKSLYGDMDFWNQMRTKYPTLFNRFVNYIKSLPKQFEQHGMYASAIVDPVALIRQYYPDAFTEISKSRSDFNSDTPEAIIIQPDRHR